MMPKGLAGTWRAYRQVGPNLPALWNPYSPQPRGRWHRPEQRAQYFALDTDGAWAEIVSRHGCDPDLVREQRRSLWSCWLQEREIADLAAAASIASSGLDLDAMTDLDDYDYCHRLSDELRAAGYRGLLSPNASLIGAVNITLFGDRFPTPVGPGAASRGDLVNRRPDTFVLVANSAELALAPSHLLPVTRPR